MASGRKVTIEFIGRDVSAGKTASDLEGRFGKLGGRMSKVGQVSGRILAGGLVLAGAAAVKAGQAAADDEAAQAQLEQQLKKAASATDKQVASVEDWITAQGKATGITDDTLRPALAKLATATGDVEEAQRLAALAIDVSAGSGKSYEQVTEAMVKAQNGNVGSLGRLGIATKDADGKAKSFAQIQKDLSGKYLGAAAKAAETTAGKQKILTTQFGELQEKIGAQLLPVMVELADVGLKVVTWISDNTRVVGIFVAAVAGLLTVTWAISAAMKAWSAITTIWSAVTKVAAGVQWLLNAAMSANPIGLVVIAIVALVAGLVVAYKKSETFRKIVNAAFGAVAKAAKVAVDFIKAHWKTILAVLTGPVGIAVLVIAKNWDRIKAGAAAVRDFVAARFAAVKDAIVNAFTRARERADAVWDAIKSGFGSVKDRLVDIASTIRTTVSNAFDAMLRPIQAVIDKVQWLIDKIKSIKIPDINIPGLRTATTPASGPVTSVISRTPPVSARGGGGRGFRGAGGGGVVINVLSLDPTTAGRYVVKALRELERETGRPLLASPA